MFVCASVKAICAVVLKWYSFQVVVFNYCQLRLDRCSWHYFHPVHSFRDNENLLCSLQLRIFFCPGAYTGCMSDVTSLTRFSFVLCKPSNQTRTVCVICTSCADPHHPLCALDAASVKDALSNILSNAEQRAAPRALSIVLSGCNLLYLVLDLGAASSHISIGCPSLTEGVNSRWLGLMCTRNDYIKDMHFKKPEHLSHRDYLHKCCPIF